MKLKNLLLFLCVTLCFCFLSLTICYCKGEKPTIVIDPGHGGTNDGAYYDGIKEKEINLKLATQLNKMLAKYDDEINVVMTRYSDDSLDLKERAEIAKKNNADILISLHFNASEKKDLFGAEVWTSAFEKYHTRGKELGQCFIDNFKEFGLLNRGIKTRVSKLEKNGDIKDIEKPEDLENVDESKFNDYYGIIRESVKRGVPAIIVEHCFLDVEKEFLTDESYTKFAEADAKAIIDYFKLGTSESGLPKLKGEIPTKAIINDVTEPEKVALNVYKNSDGEYILKIFVKDSNSKIIYFSYTIDDGKTWSNLMAFNSDDGNNLEYKLSEKEIKGNVIVKVYNNYDLFKESNYISNSEIKNFEKDEILKFEAENETLQILNEEDLYSEGIIADDTNEENNDGFTIIFSILVFIVVIISVIIVILFLKLRRK